LVPIALALMIKYYRTTNWLWLGFILFGLFMGVAPFIAAAYIFVTLTNVDDPKPSKITKVAYKPDGTYTLYEVEDTGANYQVSHTVFRVIGGVVAGAAMAFGLLIVAVIVLFMMAPSIACGGSSKGCY
jgi:phage shock protein PspC (stress-responsive transcriptional regulator)